MFKSLKIGHLTTPVISHEISSSFMFHVSRCSLAITTTVIPNLPLQQCSYHITLATKGKSILKSLRSLYIHGTGDCWKIRGFEEKNETTASDYTKSPSKRSGKSRCLISKSTGKPSANWTFSVAMFSNLYKKKMVGQGQKEKVQVELIEQQQLSGKKMQRCTKKSIKIARFMNPGRRLDSSLEAVVWILGGKISWRFPPRKHISPTFMMNEWEDHGNRITNHNER